MSVVRVKIQKDFVIVHTKVLENNNLSFKAKGLWAYCMTRPDDWQFHVKHLATVSKDGTDSVYSALKELEKEGLVKKVQKNERGRFGSVDYIIYPYPMDFKISLPHRDFPDAGFPDTVNPALPSIDSKKESINTPPPPSSDPQPYDPTPEEEEEVEKRFKERKGREPIKVPKLWKQKTLYELRAEKASKIDYQKKVGKLAVEKEERVKRHKEQATRKDNWGNGASNWTVRALSDRVEIKMSNGLRVAGYHVSDEQWELLTGWKK